MSTPRLVAFDLDDTLAPSKSAIDPRIGRLLVRLADRVEVAIISGGQLAQFTTQVVDRLPETSAEVRSHVHLLQGDGWIGQTYVAFGLSNFLWWYNDAATNDTGVLRITLTGTKISKTEFLPAYIDRKTGQPKLVTGSEKTRIANEFADLHGCTGTAAAPR